MLSIKKGMARNSVYKKTQNLARFWFSSLALETKKLTRLHDNGLKNKPSQHRNNLTLLIHLNRLHHFISSSDT